MKRGIIQKHSSFLMGTLRLLDLTTFALASVVAYKIRFNTFLLPLSYQIATLIVLFSVLIVFSSMTLYQARRGKQLLEEIRLIIGGTLFSFFTLFILLYFTKTGAEFSRQWAGTTILLAIIFCCCTRIFSRLILRTMRKRDFNTRTICIIGAGKLGKMIAERIQNSLWTGLKPVFFFDDRVEKNTLVSGIKVKGSLSEAAAYLELHPVDQIWFALPLRDEEKVLTLLQELSFNTTDIRFVPNIFNFNLLNHSVSDVAGIPVMNISSSPLYGQNRLWKFIEDYTLSIIFLTIVAPLMILISIAIKIDSTGPILFKQKRLGFDKKEIIIYKFRSMFHTPQKNEATEFEQAHKNDNRITRVGRFLRSSSLDELPQLINVLQGRMSLVGPRPHPLQLNEQYKHKIIMYMQRHKVLPGITGWAQINGYRGEFLTLDCAKNRVTYDLYYINNWSIWFDLKIIFLTPYKGLFSKKAY